MGEESFRPPKRRDMQAAMARYDFASDNTAGAAPEALEALVHFNDGFTSGYGTDVVTAEAADLVRELLDADADVRFAASGTASNAVSLAALCRPFEAVVAHQHAHVCTDETGAPGFFGHGLGLIGLPGASGRIDPDALAQALEAPDVSYRQSPAALSLTNATEYGTVYSEAEIGALTAIAKAKGLPVHLDGARLANAAAGGLDLKRLKDLGIDILIVGGRRPLRSRRRHRQGRPGDPGGVAHALQPRPRRAAPPTRRPLHGDRAEPRLGDLLQRFADGVHRLRRGGPGAHETHRAVGEAVDEPALGPEAL